MKIDALVLQAKYEKSGLLGSVGWMKSGALLH